MKPETFWLVRNSLGYGKYVNKPEIVYDSVGNPVCFDSVACQIWACSYECEIMASVLLHLDAYEAKKWRVTGDDLGGVHSELLDWIYIERQI